MKYLLFLLPLFSISVQAQSVANKQTNSSTEIGLNLGYVRDNASPNWRKKFAGSVGSSISVLKNDGNLQYGLKIIGGIHSDDMWYLAPALVLNRKFGVNNSYFYTGVMAGYVCSDYRDKQEMFLPHKTAQGYMFGLQAGYVTPIGKRLSFTTALAVQSMQTWMKYTDYEAYYPYPYYPVYPEQAPQYRPVDKTASYFILSFPVTVGLRYRL